MSGMDRLPDEALEDAVRALKGYQGDELGDDLVSRLEVISILSRRASQADLAPDAQFVTTLPQEAFDAFAKACEDAPAPSDGLREAAAHANTWLRTALSCKEWQWDEDQRTIAEAACNDLNAVLSALPEQTKENPK